jgi:hypothetical protein
LPEYVKLALWEIGISKTQSDGEILVDLVFQDNTIPSWSSNEVNKLIDKCIEYGEMSQSEIIQPEDIKYHILNLCEKAKGGRPTSSYNHLEIQWAIDERERDLLNLNPQVDVLKLANRWKHWKPRGSAALPAATQRAMEMVMKDKWTERLISHFIAKQERIPGLASVAKSAEPLREFKHLLGSARFRSVRVHCLNLEYLLSIGLVIPWEEIHLRSILNSLAESEASPAKVNRLWYSLSWLSRKLGLSTPESMSRLQEKKKAILDELASTVTTPQKKAVVPDLSVIRALEMGSLHQSFTPPDRFLMSVVRFMVGSSARFDDVQHSAPSAMKFTETTCEVLAWQTKTTSVSQIHQKPCPLICPLLSFTNIPSHFRSSGGFLFTTCICALCVNPCRGGLAHFGKAAKNKFTPADSKLCIQLCLPHIITL